MKSWMLALTLCWAGVLAMPEPGQAQEQTGYKDVVVVKGLVHVTRDASNLLQSMTITTDQGKTVNVKVDDISKDIVRIENRRVFATGTIKDNVLTVQTWFLTNRP